MTTPLITLTTDFGTQDGYTGALKGAILTICPTATIIDIAHDIPPQDIRSAAWALRRAVPYFPNHAIHVAVIDPGVGTDRRGLAVQTGTSTLVGPDNGLFDLVLEDLAAEQTVEYREITNTALMHTNLSTTFHGRDIFAPTAAWLAQGTAFDTVGPPVVDPKRLSQPPSIHDEGFIFGEIVTVDHFGNLITNISRRDLGESRLVRVRFLDHRSLPAVRGLYTNYKDAPRQTPMLLIGSSGYMEIAVGNDSASQFLGLGRSVTFKLEILG